MIHRTLEERRDFVLEHTRLARVPLVPELEVHTALAVTPVWFETARWLDDHNTTVPFWCVPWAGGQALARYILDHPSTVMGARVLDFACGGGVVALAAAKAGGQVLAVDIDPLACVATALSAKANNLELAVKRADVVGDRLPNIDVILAGDIWYERAPSTRFRRWFDRLASRGMTILTSDAGRGHPPRDVHELATYEVPTPFDLESQRMRATRVLAIARATLDGR